MDTQLLARSFASTRGVLANVRAEQLTGTDTPCASWDVRALVNHIVGGTTFFAVVAETGTPPDAVPEQADAAPAALLASFDEGVARAMRAFGAEGADERIMHMPFGDLPGSAFMNIACVDTFTHGWDLAKATGQPTELAPDLAAELLGIATAFLPDALRGPEGEAPFGPRVQAPSGAGAADQLAGFLGRRL